MNEFLKGKILAYVLIERIADRDFLSKLKIHVESGKIRIRHRRLLATENVKREGSVVGNYLTTC